MDLDAVWAHPNEGLGASQALVLGEHQPQGCNDGAVVAAIKARYDLDPPASLPPPTLFSLSGSILDPAFDLHVTPDFASGSTTNNSSFPPINTGRVSFLCCHKVKSLMTRRILTCVCLYARPIRVLRPSDQEQVVAALSRVRLDTQRRLARQGRPGLIEPRARRHGSHRAQPSRQGSFN